MRPLPISVAISLLIGVVLTACGGGGGGGTVSGGGGPSSPDSEAVVSAPEASGFSVVSGPTGAFLPGLNSTVTLVFSKDVAPASVTPSSIRLVTIADAAGLTTTPAGVLAKYTFEVVDNRVTIVPTIDFNPTNVVFGFAGDALYEISFGTGATAVKSVGGTALQNDTVSYFFRTPEKPTDIKPGFPDVQAFFVDSAFGVALPEEIVDTNGDGDLTDEVLDLFGATPADGVIPPGGGVAVVPTSPVQDLIFVFNEAVLPNTVLNTSDNSSPNIRVLINLPGQFTFQPVVAPANLAFVQQQLDLSIVGWRTDFQAYPPGGLLIVEVGAEVADLGGNSKSSVTGSNSPLLSKPVNVQGGDDLTVYSVFEDFADDAQLDAGETSARWGVDGLDVLRPSLGGGRGLDGPFVIDPLGTTDDPRDTVVPLRAVVDFDQRVARLPVVDLVGEGVFEPKAWEFSELTLPKDWTLRILFDRDGDGLEDPSEFLVQSAGHPLDGFTAPLELLVSGDVDIAGVIEVLPRDGETLSVPVGVSDPAFAAYLGQGGAGGVTSSKSGAGGAGGSVLALRDDGVPAAPLASPTVVAPGLAFDPSDGKLAGATGRSSVLLDDTLVDSDQALTGLWGPGTPGVLDPAIEALLEQGRLRLQPNLGVGSTSPAGGEANSGTANQSIDENHPTFVLTDVIVDEGAGSTTFTVDTSEQGSMRQASENVGSSYAPIATVGDSYLVGPLAGEQGGDLAGLARGGPGAEPYVVVNAFAIQTSGGGGGGGGGVAPGQPGGSSGQDSDPLVNQRSNSNGLALGDAAGAPGGQGSPRGTALVVDGLTVDLIAHTSGLDPLVVDASVLVGNVFIPAAPQDGWRFSIIAASGGVGQPKTIELAPIDVVDEFIDLTSGSADVDGPGLQPGQQVSYLILPPFGVGGSGGGGSGVSVTGTLNTSPSTLARLRPGSGGGSGGGSLRVESAGAFTLRSTGRLQAPGGAGGTVSSIQSTLAGGGGGSGGTVEVGVGGALFLAQGSRVSSAGGPGGGVEGQGRGGAGGSGWVRFENFADSLKPSTFNGLTVPAVVAENLGRLVGAPRSVAQSLFYSTGLANPEIDELIIRYRADIDGDGLVDGGLSWRFSPTGRDGGAGDFDRPPFGFRFNPTGLDSAGFLDAAGAPPTFYEPYDLVSGRTGLVHDPVAGSLQYAPGQVATVVHCLSGCADLALPSIPGVDDFAIDLCSMTIGPGQELFLLERVTGKVHVIDQVSGAWLRTITLPERLEGALVYVADGVDPALDRLVVAANRIDRLVTFLPADPDAAAPATTDYAPTDVEEAFPVLREGIGLDIEFTGLAHDAASETLWAVDALSGVLLEMSWADGSRGRSDSTSGHAYVPIERLGAGVVPSAVAFDGSDLFLTVATDPEATSLFTIDPLTLSVPVGEFMGAPVALPAVPSVPLLPERARPVAAGQNFLRFRITLDGLHDDELHGSGTTAEFRRVEIDEIDIALRNAGF